LNTCLYHNRSWCSLRGGGLRLEHVIRITDRLVKIVLVLEQHLDVNSIFIDDHTCELSCKSVVSAEYREYHGEHSVSNKGSTSLRVLRLGKNLEVHSWHRNVDERSANWS
jgi:hypothetical protein